MRFIVIAGFGLVLGFLEFGPEATFGSMIMVTLGFLMTEVQNQTKQLTVALKDHSELQVDEVETGLEAVQSTVEALRREVLVMAQAQHAMHVELRAAIGEG